MNRTIKFRAWDASKNKMREVTSINWYDEYLWVDETPLSGDRLLISVTPIMQFTGLTDKNGKEVYEGDVNDKGEILKWNVIHNCFGWFTQGGFKRHILSEVYDNKGELTTPHISEAIVGNIYENPELLS